MGCRVLEAAVPSTTVVEHLDVLEDRVRELDLATLGPGPDLHGIMEARRLASDRPTELSATIACKPLQTVGSPAGSSGPRHPDHGAGQSVPCK